MKILILASNPRKDLNLDREIRDLKGVIEKSRNREEFEVVIELAVRVEDLQDLMLRHEPQIVHFCGHGGGAEGLVFESDEVKEQWLQTEALSNLFGLCAEHLDCVLLNACYSEVQATEMIEHINYVIGMSQTIQDNAAIAFAKGFYRALGYARPIEEAYKFGCNAIQLEITGSSKVRSAATETERKLEVVDVIQNKAIPEHLKPILKKKRTLSISAPAPALTQETQTAIHLEIAEALTENSSSDQYRAKVREFLSDRKLSALEAIRLERLRKDLRLPEVEASQILAEELEPIQKGRDEYEAMLIGLIEAGHYPLDAEMEAELLAVRQELGLTDEEVEAIAPRILEAAEDDYRERLLREQQRQQEVQQQREQQLALERQRELEEQQRLEDQKRLEDRRKQEEQQRLEDQRKREEAKRRPPLKSLEFQFPTVNIVKNSVDKVIEKPGLFGKKTEVVKTIETVCNITYQRSQADYFTEDLGGITLEMVAIAGGTFKMGQTEAEKQQLIRQFGEEDYQKYFARELPQHQVTLQPFFIGKFSVTQAQYQAIMGENPASFKGEKRPVEKVSWNQAVEFCDRLSQKTGKKYRLPSEAEWEYACRAGTTTPFSFGETIATDLANYDGNYTYGSGIKGVYREETKEVGSFPPNAFGLYEMHGNVYEWCADHFHENYQGAPVNGSAWIIGGNSDYRLVRGGSWYYDPRYCRSASRSYVAPGDQSHSLGFRVVCGLA